jgi:hypothetical protein
LFFHNIKQKNASKVYKTIITYFLKKTIYLPNFFFLKNFNRKKITKTTKIIKGKNK